MMKMIKVFQSGHTQTVRLPKDFQFHSSEVEIFKRDNEVVLREKPKDLSEAFQLLTTISEDFFQDGRKDIPPQGRDFECV